MLVWTIMAVRAQTPELGVAAAAALGDGPAEQASWVGVHANVEVPVVGRLDLGGRVLGGGVAPARFSDAPWTVLLQPTARIWLTSPERVALSAVVGAGMAYEGAFDAMVSAGAALDLGPRGAIRPRVESSMHWAPGPGRFRLSLSTGLVFGRPPPPTPIVQPEPPPPRIVGEGLVWVPAPVCGWIEFDELNDLNEAGALGAVGPSSVLDAQGRRPFGAEETVEATEVPASLIVAAWPGDQITLDGQVSEASEAGLLLAHPPEGPVQLDVRGGGRTLALELAVADEHALWITVPPPPPIRILFDLGVATLDPTARALVASIAEGRGTWMLEVRGSHSPDGSAARNAALARSRSGAVYQALLDAGVDEQSVRLTDSLDFVSPDAPPEELRAAVVYPVLEGQ